MSSDKAKEARRVRSLWDVAYDLYERRVRRELPKERLPKHVGVIVDGNRRWARASGGTSESG
ncbi:MAG: hypothetical protein M3165_01525, partial [Actinomycetota bacterium]|nr:hypothetical protein [Actinomycetota bacterium]